MRLPSYEKFRSTETVIRQNDKLFLFFTESAIKLLSSIMREKKFYKINAEKSLQLPFMGTV